MCILTQCFLDDRITLIAPPRCVETPHLDAVLRVRAELCKQMVTGRCAEHGAFLVFSVMSIVRLMVDNVTLDRGLVYGQVL